MNTGGGTEPERREIDCTPTWIGGGWGIDALVREQTRQHRDLDGGPLFFDGPERVTRELRPRRYRRHGLVTTPERLREDI
ncbi:MULTISPECIES: hypothetical protein [Streptomyces]|uniref:nucleotidyltransferase domain-containing protein n=1 Tax=Streptomyces TaxID=1883 RepID=UPI001E51D709|nr:MULTISPECIES: hypothetical protein [Streptomyces]